MAVALLALIVAIFTALFLLLVLVSERSVSEVWTEALFGTTLVSPLLFPFAILAEVSQCRRLSVHIIAGSTLGMLLALFGSVLYGFSFSWAPFILLPLLAFAGAIVGAVYWMIAGQHAGMGWADPKR